MCILAGNAALQTGYFRVCKGAKFVRSRLTDSITYFQFQNLLIVGFYAVVD